MGKFGDFLADVSPAIPIVGGVISNIVEGMNTRKARLYDSPENQIKRRLEAGMPMASTSNITSGGGFTTKTAPIGTENFPSNLQNAKNSSIQRQIDRKTLQLKDQEIRSAKAAADIATGSAKNQLNPGGVYEPTNMGYTMLQKYQSDQASLEASRISNEFMPKEKGLDLFSKSIGVQKTVQEIKNLSAQERVQIAEGDIKEILARYQDDMSRNELTNLIRRNTGIYKDNILKQIAINVEYQTQLAKITMARNQALISGESLEAAKLSNLLNRAKQPSIAAYYKIRAGFDEAVLKKPNFMNTLMYLSMFQPESSNFNFGNLQNFGAYHSQNFLLNNLNPIK